MINLSKLLKLSLVILAAVIAAGGFGSGLGPDVSPAFARENAQLNTITFSPEARVTSQPLAVTLTKQAAGTIRYTTDGSLPNANSPTYTGPIPINESTVIRAQLFGADGNPVGGISTQSYILANYEQTIPVISLATDWGHFNAMFAFPEQRGKES